MHYHGLRVVAVSDGSEAESMTRRHPGKRAAAASRMVNGLLKRMDAGVFIDRTKQTKSHNHTLTPLPDGLSKWGKP